jgi:peptidoglycan-associated lipoprotein
MKSILSAVAAIPVILLLANAGTQAQAEIPTTPDNEAQILNLGAVNTPYSEYTPFITADERYLFFQSNRPDGVNNSGDFDLWYTENQVTEGVPKFKPPANVGLPVNSAYFDGHPTLRRLPSGEYEMYFASFAEEGRPGPQLTNVYYTIFKDGKWSQPMPVVEINTDFHDRMPSISQDGHYLFFSSDRPGGFGRDDIWVSEYDFAAKRWGKPRNAGRTINTPASEVTPAIHSDNITLYFSSDRAGGVGGYDIYVTQMLQNLPSASMTNEGESMWKRPVNLGKPYNSTFDDEYPTVIRNGNYMYFASNRENGQGSFDIYRGKVPEFAKPEVVVTLKGRVKEKFSDKGIEANIRITDLDGEKNFSTNQPEGLYSADLINKKQYKLTVTAPGYKPIEYIADLRDIHTPITIQKDFEMERVLALPKDVVLRITFENESGKVLKPTATYRLPPEVQDDAILPLKGSSAQLKVAAMSRYKKPEEALAALEAMRLSVKASLKGYEDLAEERPMAQLLRGSNGEIKGTIDVKFVMKGKQEDVEVIPTKGPGGLEAIVYFSTNVSNRLNNEKASGLKNVVELWNKQPHKYVYVYGHADSRGTAAHNMKLSKARAEFVKRRLVQYGIPAEMIVTRAFGETRPASKDESTAEGRRKNRRAEIYFDATKRQDEGEPTDSEAVKEAPKPAVKKPAKKKKSKPLPPEEVEPSVKVKPAKKPSEKSATTTPEEEASAPADSATPSKPEGSTFTAPAADKPAATPGAPPNTELRIK